MNAEQFLRFCIDQKASDIHLQAEAPPMLRIGAHLRGVERQIVSGEDMKTLLTAIAPPAIRDDLEASMVQGAVFTHAIAGLGRFRCNLYSHLGGPGLCLRVIPLNLPTIEELNLPPVLREIATRRAGLVLIAGEASSGRTTTLNLLVDLVNASTICKIITIEDPVEFVHTSKKAMVSHRSVGGDTPTFEQGLARALRQDPDVIVLGAVPDAATVRLMLRAAEGGRMVIAVVEGPTAVQTIDRVLDLLPVSEQRTSLGRFAGALDAVIGLRLATTKDGQRRPVVEVLRGGPATARSLGDGRVQDLALYMTGRQNGMQTFDQHLAQLHQAGLISGTEAMRLATNPENVMSELRSQRAAVSSE